MTIPDISFDSASIDEVTTHRPGVLRPGDPDSRLFRIENGPRKANSEALRNWIDDLIDEEFSDVDVVDVETDRMYVDEETADWGVKIKSEDPDRNTYRVPLSPTGEILVDATSREGALEQASKLYTAGELTERRDRATLTVSMPELTPPDSPDAVERVAD